jgi:hypothetical protein
VQPPCRTHAQDGSAGAGIEQQVDRRTGDLRFDQDKAVSEIERYLGERSSRPAGTEQTEAKDGGGKDSAHDRLTYHESEPFQVTRSRRHETDPAAAKRNSISLNTGTD